MAVSYLKRETSPQQTIFNKEDWSSAYCNVERELKHVKINSIKGKVPPELSGSFYRNGPGRLERGGRWVHHPFDGDGMITLLNFDHGEVTLSNRFVRTAEWEAEEKSGNFLYRGVFGTQKEGGFLANAFDLRLKNIANTNVVKLGDELLALWEAASPYALDPESLEVSLKGVDSLIDAATSRPEDPKSVYETDWEGKLNLYRACDRLGIKRVVFLSLLASEKHRKRT